MVWGPAGTQTTVAPTSASTITHQLLTTAALRSPNRTPAISISMAPQASVSSGRIGIKSCKAGISFIVSALLRHQGSRLGCGNGVIVIVEQLRNRRRGHVEHRLGRHAEQDREHHQWRENDGLAPANVTDTLERRLKRAKNHLAVKPQGISS